MFRNYFITAIRNLRRRKAFSIINIAGLSVGIAAALLIFIVVKHELSYDGFQKNYKRIYHIVTQNKYADGITYNPGISVPALPALRAAMPNVSFAALFSSYGSQITVENTANVATDKKFIENSGIFFCEPQFFQVFSYGWLAGDAKVLNEPNNVVLTKSIAKKYFGTWQSAMGKIIKMDNLITLKVAGILKDIPANTDIPLGVLASYKTLKDNPQLYGIYGYSTDWGSVSSNFQVFMLMPPHVTAQYISQQLTQFSKQHFAIGHVSKESIFLQPLSKMHFDTRFQASFGDHITGMSTIWTLSLIGIFILLMACINFINLSTAQAASRSKEMGIRKVLGGNRIQLFRQVMSETAFIVILSVLLAIGIAYGCFPMIKKVVSIQGSLQVINGQTVLFLFIVAIIVILLSGLYPSVVMSGFNPIVALKQKIISAKVGGVSLRRSLVITQFTISQALIICTIIVISQMSFIRHENMGFDTKAILTLNGSSDSATIARQPAFRQALLQIPGVQSVSFSSDVPSSANFMRITFSYNYGSDEPFQLYLKYADTNYLSTFDIPLVAGHIYKASDTINQVIINQTLMHKLGVTNPNDIIGKQLKIGGSLWHTITGVFRDFHSASLKTGIPPLVITTRRNFYNTTSIKLMTNNIPKTQAAIQSAWNKYYPEYAYNASFMEQNIADFYQQDHELSWLYKIFAALAIFISCLGLYGLVSLIVEHKTKEVGIRKVLGASVSQIIYLFSKEFTVMVIVAFLVATPIAYYLMHQWLNNFAYHIGMSWWIFLLAAVMAIAIALITISVKAIKAAMANPVEALRSE